MFNSREIDTWEMWRDYAGVLFDDKSIKVKGALNDSSYGKSYGDIGDEIFQAKINVDEDGFVKDSDVKILVNPRDFANMGSEDLAEITLESDGKIKVDCMMPNQWKASKIVTPIEIEGEPFPIQFNLDSTQISRALNLSLKMRMYLSNQGKEAQTWICFTRDKRFVTISSLQSPKSTRSGLNPWFIHFFF